MGFFNFFSSQKETPNQPQSSEAQLQSDMFANLSQTQKFAMVTMLASLAAAPANAEGTAMAQKILESDTILNASSIAMYAYQGLGEDAKAIDFMTSVIEKDSTNNGVYYDAACLYGRIGNYEKSLKFLQIAIEKGFDDYLHILQDYDMDVLRNRKEFLDLIEKIQLRNRHSH